ncbi:MAG: hypothetical protein L6R39_002333 [Caloplaca ligustica]|nr:MAG: hypothetical protein L6R39_002333 [Caloplaca ligustica]
MVVAPTPKELEYMKVHIKDDKRASDNIADECLYVGALLGIKFSILALYDRIFPQKAFKRVLVAVATFVLVWSIVIFFMSIFQCVPIRANWDLTVKGRCMNYGLVVWVSGWINIATDFVILGLPLPLIWRLHLKNRKKWGITFTIAAGGLKSQPRSAGESYPIPRPKTRGEDITISLQGPRGVKKGSLWGEDDDEQRLYTQLPDPSPKHKILDSAPPSGNQGQPPPPPGWIAQWDHNSQRLYYLEQATGRTQWEFPSH